MKSYALSELQAVLRGATRGVGVPAALGDDLAEAVAYAPENFEYWDELRDVFEEPISSAFSTHSSEGMTLRCLLDGPLVAEAALTYSEPVTITSVDAPNILELYLRRGSAIWDAAFDMRQTEDGSWRVTKGVALQGATPTVSRVALPGGLYEHLANFSARTFVPATAATRLSGAGAGLNDND